jgi:hypothetical protein
MLTIISDLVRRTRQHHAIEHATLHMLGARFPNRNFAGYSDPLGFIIYGDVDELSVRRAVGDALLRLQAGEAHLAIHPNCGTTLAAGTVMTTFAAMIGMAGPRRRTPDRLASGLMFVLAAQVAAKPVGLWLQGFTTTADVADRWVAEIRPLRAGSLQAHRVLFE